MDETLAEHIKLTADKGFSRDQIKKLLLTAGWPEKQVEDYIEKAFKKLDKGTLIQVHGIAKSFADHIVLEQVDFEVKQGEIFGLIGMSGTGKTTLMNLLVGFIRPDHGDILLAHPDGTTKSTIQNPDSIKHLIGFSTQTQA